MIIYYAALIGIVMLTVALIVEVWCVLRGKGLDEKIWALDTLTVSGVGFIGLFCIISGNPLYIDVAIAVTLVAFLATVVFAQYLIKVAQRGGDIDA